MITYLDRVAVRQRQDGGVSITRLSRNDMKKHGYTDEDQFIAWYMNRIAPGEAFTVISEADIPTDRSNRNEWSFKNGKVEVDQEKVVAKEAKKAEKDLILGKLKISEAELKTLLKQ